MIPKGTKFSASHKQRISESLTGKPKSLQARVNMHLAKTDEPYDERRAWSDDEIALLRKYYHCGAAYCKKRGLHRSFRSIYRQAHASRLITKGHRTPHNCGKTKLDYAPLMVVSEKLTGRRQTYEHRLHHSQTKRRLMADPAYKERFIGRLLAATSRTPNGAEQRMFESCKGLPIKYVGDGSFMIGYKNPDFLVIGQKKVIEDMCMFYHDKKLNPTVLPHRTVKATMSYYKRNGYQCLILNHKSTYFPEFIRRKVSRFIGGDVERASNTIVNGKC